MSNTKELLYAPLTVDSRKGRGGTYGYIKWQNVADRMNNIFGMCWSSCVTYEDRIDNTIIVRVKVCAKDPKSNEEYYQEGYGASVLRPSDEPGSAHKGAYSKALKDACKKWGIGLFIADEVTTPVQSSGYSNEKTTICVPNVLTPPSVPNVPTQEVPNVPTQEVPNVPTPPSVPNVPTQEVSNTSTSVEHTLPNIPEQGMSTIDVGMPPIPTTPQQMEEKKTNPDTPGTITSVQDMAIQNLARLNGVEGQSIKQFLQGVINNPECSLNRQISSLNELSYNEAVSVIKTVKNLQ